MGFRELTLALPTDYEEEQLRKSIEKKLNIHDFSYQIEKKSLDSRKKEAIYWKVRVSVLSPEIKGADPLPPPIIDIPYRKRKKRAAVIGSGPAGFFSAYVLQKAGFSTTLIERGLEVHKRADKIKTFEKTGVFSALGNYAFGEGGAGTFSDGKLTARSKHLSKEKRFIISSYIQAGAPDEIRYMAHPHLGSDNLRKIVGNLREDFLAIGGTVLFETFLEDLNIESGKVIEAITPAGGIEADYFILATGHCAYETYRMLIRRGVAFGAKNFALGCRVEHPQEMINLMQWGQKKSLAGVKAAEYRLTSKGCGNLPVYTFCMCPGGKIVQATAYDGKNIVNGMSYFKRDGEFANAACVAGVSPQEITGRESSPLAVLDRMEILEEAFYHHSKGFQAPSCKIKDFIEEKGPSEIDRSSYALGLKPAPLWEMLPCRLSSAIREGLKDFSKKLKGFETGNMIGLESKTSSPIRVERDNNRLCKGFENLYFVGEGSGYAGGIISSGADGIKAAMHIIEKNE